jgi:heat shock protein HslJ
MNRRTILALSGVALALAACNALPGGRASTPPTSVPPTSSADPSATPIPSPTDPPVTTQPSASSGLNGRGFVSVLVEDPHHQLVNGTRINLSFNDGHIGAAAGCNSIGGDYELDNGKLVVGALAETEMGCEAKLQQQDEWLVAFLRDKPAVELDGNDLVLTTADTKVTMLDREVAEPDQPLTMRTWGLTTILTQDVASSVPSGVTATLLFTDDGQVQVYDGCNSGGGKYVADGDTLTFSELVSTDMACGDGKDSVASAVLAVLSADHVTFSIDHATLTLQAGDHGLQYAAAVDVSN